jgi:hypothetical protein
MQPMSRDPEFLPTTPCTKVEVREDGVYFDGVRQPDPDPCENLLASEALDLVRQMVRAVKAEKLRTTATDRSLCMIGFVMLTDPLIEALRMTGLIDDD